jgi:hypothetical protein
MGIGMHGLVVERGGSVTSAVLFRDDQAKVSVLQIAATDEGSAADVLLAAAGGRDLRLANVQGDDVSSRALHSLGAQSVVTQQEMRLRL